MTHTAAILTFAAAPHVLPAQVRADASRLFADTLDGGAAGANTPEARALWRTVTAWGAGDEARTLNGHVLPAPSAAFFNGFAIHCLEWDAVHEGAVVHALSAVTAALLAVSDRMGGAEEEAFLTALAVGVDIASGLGIAATGPMRFFRPATAGVIGAALAAARLEGMNAAQMSDVLGLAYSFAGGTMQAHVEASIALPLQIARAAQAAVQVVDLVRAGMTGPHDVLQGPFGYHALIEPIDLARYTPTLDQLWRISEVSIKPFPSGRASHGALGALFDLRREGMALEHVASITLFAPPLIHRLIGRAYKTGMTPSYARLCLPILAPIMLRDGHIDPRVFTEEGLADPALTRLAEAVRVDLDGNADGNALGPQRLTVTLTNGDAIKRPIPATLGSPDAPMTPAHSAQKYALCRALAAPDVDPRLFHQPLSYLKAKP